MNRALRLGAGSESPDEARAYYCRTAAIDEPDYRAFAGMLSIEERARADALGRADDRRDYVVAHAMLRRALAFGTGSTPEQLVFERGAHGKPLLVQTGTASPRHFSLTHSAGLVACAISSAHAIGIDAEAIDRATDVIRIATRYFTMEEAQAVLRSSAGDRAARFFELWTLKEALLKAAGIGPATTVDCVSFCVDDGRVQLVSAPREIGTAWTLAVMDIDGSHKLATAIAGSTSRVVVTRLTSAGILDDAFARSPEDVDRATAGY